MVPAPMMKFVLQNLAVCDSCQLELVVEVHLVCYYHPVKLPLRVSEPEEVQIPSMLVSINLVFVLVVFVLGTLRPLENLPWNWAFLVVPAEDYLIWNLLKLACFLLIQFLKLYIFIAVPLEITFLLDKAHYKIYVYFVQRHLL